MQPFHGDRQSIDTWLHGFNAQERSLKEYYLRYGRLQSREEHSAAFPGSAGDDRQADPVHSQILTESMYINNHTDVAIVKHPRYMARFDHSHTFFEVSYVVDGTCNHVIHAYGASESVTLQRGDVFILPPSIVHNILVDDDSVVVNILMRRSTFDNTFLQGLPTGSVLSNFFTGILYSGSYANFLLFRTDDAPLVRDTFYSILQEYHHGEVFASKIINQLLGLFFLYLLRECGDRVRISREYHREARCIPAIIHYLESNYATASIAALARHFGYDGSHLSRLYKSYTGATLRETLCQIRMRHSSELLRASERSVDEIASLVGYRDVSSFIRRFRRQFGETPLQYRVHNRIENR